MKIARCFYADINVVLSQELDIRPLLQAQTYELLESRDIKVVGPFLKSALLSCLLLVMGGRIRVRLRCRANHAACWNARNCRTEEILANTVLRY